MLAVLAIAFAVGCGGDSTGPSNGTAEGTLKFDYSGAISGTFSAKGTPTQRAVFNNESYAFAVHDDSEDVIAMTAFRFTNGLKGDAVMFFIDEPAVGNFSLNVDTCEKNCGFALFYFNVDFADTVNVDGHVFVAELGEISLSKLTAKSVAGTFHGTAVDPEDAEKVIQVSNGSFSVQIVDESEFPIVDLSPLKQPIELSAAKVAGFEKLSAARQARVLEVFEQLRQAR